MLANYWVFILPMSLPVPLSVLILLTLTLCVTVLSFSCCHHHHKHQHQIQTHHHHRHHHHHHLSQPLIIIIIIIVVIMMITNIKMFATRRAGTELACCRTSQGAPSPPWRCCFEAPRRKFTHGPIVLRIHTYLVVALH